MDADRYRQVKTILADVLERPPAERAALIAARCGSDADLRAEVESLLAYESDEEFMVPGVARRELLRDQPAAAPPPPAAPPRRRVLKIVATREGRVVWTDRVPHDTDAVPGATGVISMPPFEIQLSIETIDEVVAEPTVRIPRGR